MVVVVGGGWPEGAVDGLADRHGDLRCLALGEVHSDGEKPLNGKKNEPLPIPRMEAPKCR